jgi:hypothetical protein
LPLGFEDPSGDKTPLGQLAKAEAGFGAEPLDEANWYARVAEQ